MDLKYKWMRFTNYLWHKWDESKAFYKDVGIIYLFYALGYLMKGGRDTVHFHPSNMVFPKTPFFLEISSGQDPAWMWDAWHMFDYAMVICFVVAMIIALKRARTNTSVFRMLIEFGAIGYIVHKVGFGWLLTV